MLMTKAIFQQPAQRVILPGSFAVAVAAAPIAAYARVPSINSSEPTVTACGSTQMEDPYTGACVPGHAPNIEGGNVNIPNAAPPVRANAGARIPCVVDLGLCIGLSESRSGAASPLAPPSRVEGAR